MKRVLLAILALGISIAGGLWFYKSKNESPYSKALFIENKSFYVPLHVEKFSTGRIPCFNVEIENKKLLFRLDLGSNDAFSISKERLANLKDKTFFTTRSACGVRGNVYSIDVYQIPKMKMGPITFSPLTVSEEIPKYQEEVIINGREDEDVSGKMGWKLFHKAFLMLDLERSIMVMCDSLETFLKQGYSLDKFIKIPMSPDNKLIEFETMSSRGPLHCMLDTGCTLNFLNRDSLEGESLEDHLHKKRNYKKVSSFKISDAEFGPLEFYKIPIQLPIHIDAILGMEFLMKHVVFIDFNNRQIYFSKY